MLSKGDFESARSLFDEALRIEPSRRDVFLADRCAGNEKLAANLRKLLDAHDSGGAFLDQTGAGLLTGIQVVAEWMRPLPTPELRPDQTFGRYRILQRLGAGGMGEVYLAEDPNLGRRVAIKLLRPGLEADETRKRRLEREARLTSLLNHPNIMTVYDIGQAEGRMFIAAEFVDGVTLRQKLAEGPLPLIEALRIAVRVADALEAAHAGGVIHRDIKPENVMIRHDGGIKVLDFGAATAGPSGTPEKCASLDAALPFSHAASQAFGTIGYASPEQVQGMELDARTDVWSLGALLYELVSGQSPFAAPASAETIRKILNEAPPPLPAPANRTDLRHIVGRALAKPLDERYPSMKDFRDDIDRARQRLTRKPRAAAARWLLVAALIASPLLWRAGFWKQPAPAANRVAVLKFRMLTTDPAIDYLSTGLTDAIITRLADVQGINVRPISAVLRVAENDPVAAARLIGADLVLDGKIQRVDDAIRVTVQMLRASNNASVWADTFDEKLTNLFVIEDSISNRVATSVLQDLNPAQKRALAKVSTRNGEAHQEYLRGRYYLQRYTPEASGKARASFLHAIELDPGFALAYSGLAEYYYSASNLQLQPRDAMPKAKAAADSALRLDPSLAEAHVMRGLIAAKYEWDWPTAEHEFREGLRLNPNAVVAHQYYALYRAQRGAFGEAAAELSSARDLDPLSPDIEGWLGAIRYWSRDYSTALSHSRRALDLEPSFFPAQIVIAWSLEAQRRPGEAVDAARKAEGIARSSWTLAALARATASTSDKDQARRLLTEFLAGKRNDYASPYDAATVQLALGDTQAALDSLEQAYEERAEWLSYAKVDPPLDPVRSNPRFQALLHRLKLDR